ncbi:ATP-binding cassette domain-containing protein [Bacillus sp. Hm123]|uniref:ATP-binding cassette domain-containing protein n=1 Tax=Bacillus sp. Hm123 TaxID=3450745 RepID=UPI003F4404D9
MENILKLENISYSYGKKKILDQLSFTCGNGITALLGNNGAGKTTLMKILTGLNPVQTGSATLNGTEMLRGEYPLHDVGYLPQNFEMYKDVSGYQFLSFVYDIKKMDKHRKKASIEEVVHRFNLEKVIHKNIGRYSGGYKQRLGIAQAVLGKPSLIIIDEPTVGLDPEQRVEFRSYLSEISKDSITIISTHIIEDIELYSDQILILKDAEIQFNGTIKEIIESSRPFIYTTEVNRTALPHVKKQVKVIEEKRLATDTVKIKYVQSEQMIENSYPDKEISLENAYLYFQNK